MSAPGGIRAASVTRDDWQTPDDLYQWLNRIFGPFTWDAAATKGNSKTETCYFGPDKARPELQDGLALVWDSEDNYWANPPYGNLAPWVEKFATSGARVCALLPANTDTKWFRLAHNTASTIWFLTPRVSFVMDGKPVAGNTGGSMVAVWEPGRRHGSPHVALVNWKEEVR